MRTESEDQGPQPFDEIAEKYQALHGQNPATLSALSWLDDRLPRNSRVLDLGCGTGVPTARTLTTAGHEVVGVDLSEGMLALARKQAPQAEFLRLDIRDAALQLGSFNAVTAFFSLLMLPKRDIPTLLANIRSSLEPPGLLVLSMIPFDADEVPIDFLGATCFVSGYEPAALGEVLTSAGFTVEEMRTSSYTPPGMPAEIQVYAYCRATAPVGQS